MMNTLELTLQRKTDSGYPVVAALTHPGGFLPLRREGMLNLDVPALAELQYDPLAYGTTLGQALFVDEIRDTFREGLSGGKALRVQLAIEAPDLHALDWHRLAAPMDGGRWRCLASQQNTPFSLSIPSPASAHFPAIGRRDLRALLLVAGPESLSGDYKLAPFDVPATLAGIQESLGDIPCDVLQSPSLDALCAALTQTSYTFLHLVCHGSVKKETGETILFFPKDSKGSPTTTSELLNRLGSLVRLPHFAFVAACESALPQNGLGSLAGRLVRELGLPAVLAMTDRVSIATAGAIAAPFYAHLYQHGQPDLALAQSLAGLQGAHDLTVPAIFSRLGDRPLFDDNSERALTDKELEFGLDKLAESLPERAPVLMAHLDTLSRRLRSTLGADSKSLSESSRAERKESLDGLNSLSLETLDLSFNALCLGQTPPAYDSHSPFRGLESFRPENAPYFFGRETLTKKLVQKLNEHNFLAVLGASGSGKSSLVMAGLIPALNVPYAIFRPGAEPLAELDKALQGNPTLLVVDQFEELFTLSAREQRSEFISRLLEQVHKIRVVITLRADFLGEVAPFKSLKDEVQNHQEIIPPMDEAELRRAMEGQAGCTGLRFESDLSKQMLDDVSGEPGAMPLLQHALWTLWTRRHGRWLRAEEYRAFGGVKQAIASTAESVYARCTDFEKERLRDIFLRLTRLDEGADGRDTRRRVLLRDLIPADSDPAATTLLVKQLADARLVVVTGDTVEVAHEALIRHWERLRAWRNDDRDNLRLREGVSNAANAWHKNPKNTDLLIHRGGRLEDAFKLKLLTANEKTYLNSCKTAIQMRRRLTVVSITFALIVIMAILAGWGWTSNENSKQLGYQVATSEAAKATAIANEILANDAKAEAQHQARVALARQLAAQAQAMNTAYSSKQLISTLLSIQSINLFSISDATSFLATNNKAALPLFCMNHDGGVTVVTVSPDGNYVASGSLDYTVRIWNASNGKEVTHMIHNLAVTSIAFSPDGKYLVSGSRDKTVRMWEMPSGKEIVRMTNSGEVESVAFSPDGKYVAAGSNGKNIPRVWEALSGKEIVVYPNSTVSGHAGGGKLASLSHTITVNSPKVTSVAFSPDGRYLLSGSWDNTARIWEIPNGQEIVQMKQSAPVTSVSFSPDGKYAVVGSYLAINVYKVSSGQEIVRMAREDSTVNSLAFSPDGKYIVAGSEDHSARVWDVETGLEVARVTHDSTVNMVAFSPDGKYVISGSSDNTARIWEASSGVEITRMTHDNEVNSVAFSSDGKYMVSGSADNSVYIWEISNGAEISHVDINSRDVFFAFSPDGKYVISANSFHAARMWEVSSGDRLAVADDGFFSVRSAAFSSDGKYEVISVNRDEAIKVRELPNGNEVAHIPYNGLIISVAFSLDGKHIVSGSDDGAVFIWDAMNGREIAHVTHDNSQKITSVNFSPNGKYVVSGSQDKTARVWDVSSGVEVARVTHDGYVNSVAFSPDGKYVVSGSSDNTVRIWETTSGVEKIRMLHDAGVNSVAFNPNGRYVVSGSADNTARIWEISSGQEVVRSTWDNDVHLVIFSPNGKYIASADGNYSDHFANDTVLRIWIWQPNDLVIDACFRMPRNLTRAEWQQYIGDALPYQAVCDNLPIEPEPIATPTP